MILRKKLLEILVNIWYRAKMFTKFGLLCEILPFLGYFQKWEALLWSLNKSTSRIFVNNQQGFENLNNEMLKDLGSYEDAKELWEILIESKMDKNATIANLPK